MELWLSSGDPVSNRTTRLNVPGKKEMNLSETSALRASIEEIVSKKLAQIGRFQYYGRNPAGNVDITW